jgi:hypothetical protein
MFTYAPVSMDPEVPFNKKWLIDLSPPEKMARTLSTP